MTIEFLPIYKNGVPEYQSRISTRINNTLKLKSPMEAITRMKLNDHKFLLIGIHPSFMLNLLNVNPINYFLLLIMMQNNVTSHYP
ncbi:hypothetical protein BpHYR1_017073 [Brachionus plicatilis]|uniref:Uncharacterized protein n=1 Tax=Brachionus plicatilis TaxID=10195 RepID=A0A3M7RQR3_BRAPC|nr:hypothetical protein BpHYR1_017073 [Brachionus plicatilis]